MTATRPDLAFAVTHLSRFMTNPAQEHFIALNRIWRYLIHTTNYGLSYSLGTELKSYCDSDWGGDIISRKSTTGYILLFGNSAISWSSQIQKTVALSSCEAEYMALIINYTPLSAYGHEVLQLCLS